MKLESQREGAFFAALSYLIWGIIPMYWKMIQDVSAGEILAHRIIWSFVFMVILLLISRKWKSFVGFLKEIAQNRKILFSLFLASVLISINWGTFIWAVNAGKIMETSLGYYINPLVSVLLGVIVLKEKLSKQQVFAFTLAGAGVLILGIYFGSIPWISLILAVTFGLYGLAKKMIKADSAMGLTLETLMVTPFALGYIIYILSTSGSAFFAAPHTALLLMGGGVVTALPLLFFAKGAQKVPLSMLGILQYIGPTLSLMLSVFVYHESFTKVHLLAFIFIWSALVIYTLSITKKRAIGSNRLKKHVRHGA